MKITFSSMLSTFVVHAPEGTLVSLSATPTEIGDGVYAVGDSGMVLVDEEYQTDTIYLSTEGEDYTVEAGERICYPAEDIIVWGGNAPDRSPFPKSGKGGGGSGGDNTHYKGTTTTAISNGSTTNPITIDGESYTAVFGDIVVYGYTEFVFDGTAWGEFGRPFDTTPTSGSANAVTSDGIATVVKKGTKSNSVVLGNNSTASGSSSVSAGDHAVASGNNSAAFNVVATASGAQSFAANYHSTASGLNSTAFGNYTSANQANMTAIGKFNSPRTGDLFNIGNGTANNARSNIVEVNDTSMNVNGDIKCHNLVVPVGGYEETVLYTASSPHTNNIELSQAYTNFDDIVVVWTYSASSGGEYYNRYQQAFKTSALIADDNILVGEVTSGGDFTAYTVVDTTHIDFTEKTGTYYNWISKVIGIKYPKLYVPPVSLNQAPATLLTNQTEEPTDEMR